MRGAQGRSLRLGSRLHHVGWCMQASGLRGRSHSEAADREVAATVREKGTIAGDYNRNTCHRVDQKVSDGSAGE